MCRLPLSSAWRPSESSQAFDLRDFVHAGVGVDVFNAKLHDPFAFFTSVVRTVASPAWSLLQSKAVVRDREGAICKLAARVSFTFVRRVAAMRVFASLRFARLRACRCGCRRVQCKVA